MLPLVGAFLGVSVLVLLVIVELGARLIERADAQTVADVAALAAVHEGRPGAADLAERNGAELLQFNENAGVAYVEVRVGRMRAEAWAELDWLSTPIPGG
jgi:uncharacterized membrane protein